MSEFSSEREVCEYTLDDWFELYFPLEVPRFPGTNAYICMVFETYLDDSGHKPAKLMVSAGFCANREVWRDFRQDWKRLLANHSLRYFKSSECNHVSGEFRKLRKGKYAQDDEREEARKIRADFLGLVARHRGIVGVGVAVEMEAYSRLASLVGGRDILPQDPYKAALSSVIFETVRRVRSRDPRCMVVFLHDGNDRFDEFRGCYSAFRKLNPKTAKHCGGFAPQDDKQLAELQAADLIANHVAYIGSNSPDERLGLLEMRENIAFLARWDEPYIAAILKHGLAKRGKPIPLELGNLE